MHSKWVCYLICRIAIISCVSKEYLRVTVMSTRILDLIEDDSLLSHTAPPSI